MTRPSALHYGLSVRLLLLATAALLTTWSARAVGLGEISVQSHLGQPLVAEVSLSADESAGLQVKPAPVSSYAQHGMEAPGQLGRIDTDVVRKADGRRVLRVTSERPVNEPIVELLVQARDQSGRPDRQLTLLVNPVRHGKNANPENSVPTHGGAGARNARAPTSGARRHSTGKQAARKTRSKKIKHRAAGVRAHRHHSAASMMRARSRIASGLRKKKALPPRLQTGSGGVDGKGGRRHAQERAGSRRVR